MPHNVATICRWLAPYPGTQLGSGSRGRKTLGWCPNKRLLDILAFSPLLLPLPISSHVLPSPTLFLFLPVDANSCVTRSPDTAAEFSLLRLTIERPLHTSYCLSIQGSYRSSDSS
ncbi:hypothetical protein TgHK011_004544 [Trichoderma gracile]|nr:hypothetical protein TgHK011_004544 [Trichoderma gracile]